MQIANVAGWSLHFFSERANSDKFYRVFSWKDPASGCHKVAFHWGRDGTRGQASVQDGLSGQLALVLAERRVQRQQSKGYDLLGQTTMWVTATELEDLAFVGAQLHERVGVESAKAANKPPLLVIREDDEVTDLLEISP